MSNQDLVKAIQNRVRRHNRYKNGKLTFTVEYGKGETYSNGDITLYSHDNYERSSVLYGRRRRCWIGSLDSSPNAEQVMRDSCKEAGIMKITEFMLGGGTTHIPVEQVVSHLPDDTDY